MKTTVLIVAAVVLLLLNLNSFRLMAKDKKAAKKGDRRVPEKTLFLAAGLFGGLGGVIGMQALRHKTKHWYFAVFFPVFLVIQVALIVVGVYFLMQV